MESAARVREKRRRRRDETRRAVAQNGQQATDGQGQVDVTTSGRLRDEGGRVGVDWSGRRLGGERLANPNERRGGDAKTSAACRRSRGRSTHAASATTGTQAISRDIGIKGRSD